MLPTHRALSCQRLTGLSSTSFLLSEEVRPMSVAPSLHPSPPRLALSGISPGSWHALPRLAFLDFRDRFRLSKDLVDRVSWASPVSRYAPATDIKERELALDSTSWSSHPSHEAPVSPWQLSTITILIRWDLIPLIFTMSPAETFSLSQAPLES